MEIRLSQFEITELNEVKNDYQEALTQLGSLVYEQVQLERQIEIVKDNIDRARWREQELHKKLWKQYGDGIVDLENGVFRSDNVPPTAEIV